MVEAVLSAWRQGDVCLECSDIPALVPGGIVEGLATAGVVMLSQTCDILQPYDRKPYVQIGRLLKVENDVCLAVERFQRPRYLYVPILRTRKIVCDLDVVATIDKREVANWARLPGAMSPQQQRDFGYAAGRHRSRFAFPDPWAIGFEKLRHWVVRKSSKSGEDGRFLRQVWQMRVHGDVSLAQPPKVEVLCMMDSHCEQQDREAWTNTMVPKMVTLVASTWCSDVSFRLVSAEEMTAAEYLLSYRLDFDALSPV